MTRTFGDFNGDGLTDVLVGPTEAGGSVQLAKGDGTFAVTGPPIGWTAYQITPGDYNGDGRTDIALIAPNGGTHLIMLSTGSGFVQVSVSGLTSTGATTSIVADWNNDGASDLWIKNAAGDVQKMSTYTPELLSSVSNGLGITTTFTYSRLNNPTVYTRESGDAYPVSNLNGAFYVVSRVDSSNGIGTGNYSSTYKYAGAKSHLEGRGFLGFHTRTITDLQTNIVQKSTYRQDWPFLGLIAEEKKCKR